MLLPCKTTCNCTMQRRISLSNYVHFYAFIAGGLSVNAADWATACHNLHFNPRKLHFFLCRYQRFIHSVCQSVGWLVDFLSDKQQLIKYWIIVSLRCSSPSSSSSLSLLLSVNGNFYSRYCCWTQFYGYTYYCGLSTNRLLNREMRWSCHEWRWWKSLGYTHKKIIKAKFKKSGKTILIAKSSWELVQWPQTHCIKICRDGKQ